MKKLVASLLCVMMIFSIVACGSDSTSSNANTKPSTPTNNESNENKDDNNKEENNKEENNKEESNDDTEGLTDANLSGKLALEFKKKIQESTDITAIAESLSAEDFCGYVCGTMDVEEGFLNGFSEEIKGFKKGVMFMPMIGSIPFVNYIFETDDAEGLKATLLAKADPRWNICTEANEKVCVTSGNYVFFTMCP